jgi:cyclin-dependent kinase 7
MVLELCPTDLGKIIKDKDILIKEEHCKAYMLMLLKGMEHLHDRFILHRGLNVKQPALSLH